MRWPHPMIFLLIVASVLVDLCLWLADPSRNGPEALLVTFLALLLSQVSLLAVWASIGRSKPAVRIVIAGLGTAALFFATVRREGRENYDPMIFLLVEQSAVIILSLFAMRLAGYRLYSLADIEIDSSDSRATMQFSIFNILQLTTAAAIVAAIGAHLVITRRDALDTTFISAVIAIPIPLITIALLCSTKLAWKVAMAAITAVAAMTAVVLVVPELFDPVAWFCCGQYLLVAGSLFIVRLAGYRFGRSVSLSNEAGNRGQSDDS